jgi:signal transduction histidine kinase
VPATVFSGEVLSRTGRLLAVGLLALGLAATAAVVGQMRHSDRLAADRMMDQRTQLARRAVSGEVDRYLDAVRLVSAAAGGYEPLTLAKYLAATRPLTLVALPGATAVTFIVPGTRERVAAEQLLWRQRGSAGLLLTPVGPGREHQFSVFTRSLDGSDPAAVGVDVTQVPAAAAVLAAARRSGQPALSDTYTLRRDADVPVATRQLSFVLAAPVYTRPVGAAEPVLLGWVAMSLRGGDFIGAALQGVVQGVVAASLWADDSSGRQVQVSALTAGGSPDLRREVGIDVAQRSWTLRTSANRAALVGGAAQLISAGAGGVLSSLLLAGLVLVLATGRARARAEVVSATAEISRTEQASRLVANRLTVLVDSLTEGISVVDADGRLIMQNTEAQHLLGMGRPIGTAIDWTAETGLFRPDRTTPFPGDEMPLFRAMAGQSTVDVEMFVCNAGRPEGGMLAISSRPLEADAGRWGAVAVIRDITREREHRDALAAANGELAAANSELEAFSYSVSHDLRAPLRRMDGFASLLIAEQGAALPPVAADYLVRIRASAQRMSALIDDLLAFSRLGRQSLRRQLVRPAVIVRAALAQLGDQYADRDVRVTIGDLSGCMADPALLEQVYVNLLSNAIKFTRAREHAVIEVSSRVEGYQTVYTVADNGVGFDPRYADKLFAVFQRLHAGDDYEGTGVGLALVQRIVQRHGGRVWADLGPEGGAAFHFTVADQERSKDRVSSGAPSRPPDGVLRTAVGSGDRG